MFHAIGPFEGLFDRIGDCFIHSLLDGIFDSFVNGLLDGIIDGLSEGILDEFDVDDGKYVGV